MENTIGTRIHIKNSQEYLELSNQYHPWFDMKFEKLVSLLSNEGVALSEMIGANSDKVELYTLINILSKIDGGEELLNCFNGLLLPEKRVVEKDILLNRLAKIFPDYKEIFGDKFLEELEDLYSDVPKSLEAQIVKIVYILEMIAQTMKRNGKWSPNDSTKFMFNNIKEIGDNYKITKSFNLKEEYKKIYDGLKTQNTGYVNDYIQDLKHLAQEYNDNLIEQTIAIDILKGITNKKKVELGTK